MGAGYQSHNGQKEKKKRKVWQGMGKLDTRHLLSALFYFISLLPSNFVRRER
jgi:hypothetical protein